MKIVVGTDGSEAAHAAIDFACEEAKRWHAELTIVHAWNYVYTGVDGFGGAGVDLVSMIEPEAQKVLDAEAAYAAGKCGNEVSIQKILVHDSAAAAVLHEGKDAAMIVVGSRGRGGFSSLLLGSTSNQVVHHATTPVVVIRQPEG